MSRAKAGDDSSGGASTGRDRRGSGIAALAGAATRTRTAAPSASAAARRRARRELNAAPGCRSRRARAPRLAPRALRRAPRGSRPRGRASSPRAHLAEVVPAVVDAPAVEQRRLPVDRGLGRDARARLSDERVLRVAQGGGAEAVLLEVALDRLDRLVRVGIDQAEGDTFRRERLAQAPDLRRVAVRDRAIGPYEQEHLDAGLAQRVGRDLVEVVDAPVRRGIDGPGRRRRDGRQHAREPRPALRRITQDTLLCPMRVSRQRGRILAGRVTVPFHPLHPFPSFADRGIVHLSARRLRFPSPAEGDPVRARGGGPWRRQRTATIPSSRPGAPTGRGSTARSRGSRPPRCSSDGLGAVGRRRRART